MTGRASDPMRGWVESFPESLEEAWNTPLPEGFAHEGTGRIIVPCGMGGSGMAGAIAAVELARIGRPVVSWRDSGLPRWVGAEDALVLISYSGETWEAIALLDEAIERGVPARAVASGGRLAARCAEAGIPCLRVPQGMAPRASLPWLLAGVFRAAGGIDDALIRDASAALREDRDAGIPGRDPVHLAAALEGRIACLIPAGSDLEPIALRWRNQILENAKQAAFVSPLPEMAHNEIMGWRHLRDAGAPVTFIALIARSVAPRTRETARALEREALDLGIPFIVVPPPRADGLAGQLAEVQLGDRMSVELADRLRVAATPVEAIRRLRGSMGNGKEQVR